MYRIRYKPNNNDIVIYSIADILYFQYCLYIVNISNIADLIRLILLISNTISHQAVLVLIPAFKILQETNHG